MMDSLVIDIPSWEIGRVAVYAESVLRGVKPLAELRVHAAQVALVERELARLGVQWESQPVGTTHRAFLFFLHPYLRAVARRALGLPYDSEVFEHWVRGKMYGYAEEQIAECCQRQCEHAREESQPAQVGKGWQLQEGR
jgi:hypothetical protein